VTKQNMRFVQIKTQEQLDWQAMHRVRDRLMQHRTALINEIRGFLPSCVVLNAKQYRAGTMRASLFAIATTTLLRGAR